MEAAGEALTYLVDADDILIAVNGAWDRFAASNGAAELGGGAVIGRCLWDFVADARTIALERELAGRVRANGRELQLTFRCDSPTLRRRLSMRIRPTGGGRLEYRCTLLNSEPRDLVPLLLPLHDGSTPPVELCSWCKRVLLPGNRWTEVEDATVSLGLLEAERLPPIRHTLCGDCEAVLRRAT